MRKWYPRARVVRYRGPLANGWAVVMHHTALVQETRDVFANWDTAMTIAHLEAFNVRADTDRQALELLEGLEVVDA